MTQILVGALLAGLLRGRQATVSRTVELGHGIRVDLDVDGTPLGVDKEAARLRGERDAILAKQSLRRHIQPDEIDRGHARFTSGQWVIDAWPGDPNLIQLGHEHGGARWSLTDPRGFVAALQAALTWRSGGAR